MRQEVVDFLSLGPLPDSSAAEEEIAKFERHLLAIAPPLSDEEAEHLVDCFGPDECFGLAWELVHLIESSATPFPRSRPGSEENAWKIILYDRYQASME